MRNKEGFVLIEILMDGLAMSALAGFVALMGVQSVLAVPRWTESRQEARLATVRLDLENLVARQALHHADSGWYASSTEELGFSPARGVEIEVVASPGGWSAAARHGSSGARDGCAFYAGSALPPSTPITPERPGTIVCTE